MQQAERHNENVALGDSTNKVWLNPSRCLVDKALERWSTTKMRADNTSVVTLMLDPPGPPRAQVLRNKRKSNYADSGLEIMTRFEENVQTKTDEMPAISREIDKNFVVKPRESTSFHPNEPEPSAEPENIQINEISSSSSSSSNEETMKTVPEEKEKPTKMNLRSTNEEAKLSSNNNKKRCCENGCGSVEIKKRKIADTVKKRHALLKKKATEPICSEAVSSSNSTKENIKPRIAGKSEHKTKAGEKTKVLQEDGNKNSRSTKGNFANICLFS